MVKAQGASDQEATTLTAIAMAESHGNINAINPTDNHGKQTSWGLFQISDGTHNEPGNWNDPTTNIQMALAKIRGAQSLGRKPFSPWGTYNSGAYLQFLPGASGVGGR